MWDFHKKQKVSGGRGRKTIESVQWGKKLKLNVFDFGFVSGMAASTESVYAVLLGKNVLIFKTWSIHLQLFKSFKATLTI